MRVIAGKAKGMKLEAPEGLSTRPTLDKVREAVFGSIQFDVIGAACLDLFSGSGAMGIEALSRGAEKCVFVDNDIRCIKIIKENLKNTGLSGNVLNASFDKALEGFAEGFDFVFMDPPYASGYYEKALSIIAEKNLLNENGVIICEHDGTLGEIDGYSSSKARKYGKAFITKYYRE